jgi:hypothetical protein
MKGSIPTIEDHVSNLDYKRDVASLFGHRSLGLGITRIEVWGEPPEILVTSAVAPSTRIRKRIEAENEVDAPAGTDGRTYAVQQGEPMKTYLVALGRLALRDMYGATCAPSQLADGPVRLYFTWDTGPEANTVRYELRLGQLADLLAEITREARR